MKSPHKIMFSTTLIMSTMMMTTSSSWITTWMYLEINMLSFIPLIMVNETTNESEATVKYLIPQSLASTMFIISSLTTYQAPEISFLMTAALLLKLGAAPFHLWFPPVMNSITMMPALILLTWQKIAPLFALLSMKELNQQTLTIIAPITAMWGSLMGVNQTDIRSILTYSSIAHLGWMMAAIQSPNFILPMYTITYIFLTASIFITITHPTIKATTQFSINNLNPNLLKLTSISILSLAGLPPMTGFILKLTIIMHSTMNSTVILILILSAIISLFFYLNMFISSSLAMKSHHLKQMKKKLSMFLLCQTIPLPLLTLTL
uniref:NADH-ubiquinone oxidoreductase chain 2 n=1 Tax=Mutela dubia TaxID=152234 RepID=A0A1X9JNE1_9BIVA|nr:NADH dehydrogenase subunit 2 [Mutela dubia]AQT38515.1 NADH dehydrogenase subunit 2 [Mutela dubia]